MAYRTRIERRLLRRRRDRLAIALLAGYFLCVLLDRLVWRTMTAADERWLESRDWYQLLRQLGYMPTWILVGVACGFADLYARRRGEPDRGPRSVMIILAPALAGTVAEILKRTIGRERPPAFPVASDSNPLPEWPSAAYTYKDFLAGWVDDSNLGLPSSHAAVAFGALVLLGLMHRGARPIFWAVAAGCAASRVLAGAHWLSDVYAGGVIGGVCAWLTWKWLGRDRSRDARDIASARGWRLG